MQMPLVSSSYTMAPDRYFPQMDPHRVIAEVAAYYGLSVSHLTMRDRHARVVLPRQIAYYMLWYEAGSGLSGYDIGRMFGRCSATIYHGAAKIADLMTRDLKLKAEIMEIHRKITGPPSDSPSVSACLHPNGECECYMAGYVAGREQSQLELRNAEEGIRPSYQPA